MSGVLANKFVSLVDCDLGEGEREREKERENKDREKRVLEFIGYYNYFHQYKLYWKNVTYL